MKKIISILLVLLIVVSVAPLALAEDEETASGESDVEPVLISVEEEESEDEELDEETEEEIEAMDNQYGAEVRLLQLELAIAKNIGKGNDVIAKAQELEKDVSELEAIIGEMEALKEEVIAADPAAEDAVQTFVDLKKDARDLSKEFREKAREIIPPSEANKLRERLKEKMMAKLDDLKEKITEKRMQFNARRLGALFRKMNIKNEELIKKLKAGEITVKEVKTQTREQFKAMSPEERRNAFTAAKEAGVKRAVEARAKADGVMLRYIERKETRITNRLDKLKGIKKEGSFKKYSEQRLQKIEQAKTRVESRIEKREQVAKNIQTKVQAGKAGDTQ